MQRPPNSESRLKPTTSLLTLTYAEVETARPGTTVIDHNGITFTFRRFETDGHQAIILDGLDAPIGSNGEPLIGGKRGEPALRRFVKWADCQRVALMELQVLPGPVTVRPRLESVHKLVELYSLVGFVVINPGSDVPIMKRYLPGSSAIQSAGLT